MRPSASPSWIGLACFFSASLLVTVSPMLNFAPRTPGTGPDPWLALTVIVLLHLLAAGLALVTLFCGWFGLLTMPRAVLCVACAALPPGVGFVASGMSPLFYLLSLAAPLGFLLGIALATLAGVRIGPVIRRSTSQPVFVHISE